MNPRTSILLLTLDLRSKSTPVIAKMHTESIWIKGIIHQPVTQVMIKIYTMTVAVAEMAQGIEPKCGWHK